MVSNKACPGKDLQTFGGVTGDSSAQEELQNGLQHCSSRSKETPCNSQAGERLAGCCTDAEGETTDSRYRQKDAFLGRDRAGTSKEYYTLFEHLNPCNSL